MMEGSPTLASMHIHVQPGRKKYEQCASEWWQWYLARARPLLSYVKKNNKKAN